MWRRMLEWLLHPEVRNGACIITLYPETFGETDDLAGLMIRTTQIARVVSSHSACLVMREPDGSLVVYAIPDGEGPDDGGERGQVLSFRDHVVAEAIKAGTRVA